MQGAPKLLGQLQSTLGMLTADRAVVRVRIGPAGMPVRLAGVCHGIHHEGIDIRYRQPVTLQVLANRSLTLLQKQCGPRVRDVGQYLDPGVAQLSNLADRVLDRKMQIRIAAECQSHEETPSISQRCRRPRTEKGTDKKTVDRKMMDRKRVNLLVRPSRLFAVATAASTSGPYSFFTREL